MYLLNRFRIVAIVIICIFAGIWTLTETVHAESMDDYEYVLLEDGNCEIKQYNGIETNVVIPNEIDGHLVASIGPMAFSSRRSLTEVVFNDNIRTIGNNAFSGCLKLKSVALGRNVECIGEYAFMDCPELKEIDLPSTIKSIGWDAFGIQDDYGEEGDCYFIITINYAGTKAMWDKIDKPYHCVGATVNYNACVFGREHSYETYKTTATMKREGKSQTKCKLCGEILKESKWAKINNVKLSTTSYTYNGKSKKPSVTVKTATGKKLTKDKSYTVSYEKGRKKVGEYTVTIKFKGNYSGTVKRTFTIKPKKTSVTNLSKGDNRFTVKWKKVSTQCSGYQIQYSRNSSFKDAKKITVKGYGTTKKTIKGLKDKKKYYVRVRTYKNVDGERFYSKWSEKKSVTTK